MRCFSEMYFWSNCFQQHERSHRKPGIKNLLKDNTFDPDHKNFFQAHGKEQQQAKKL